MKGIILNQSDSQKIQMLEQKIKRLEDIIKRLSDRLDYFDREKQRIKSDVSNIFNSLKRL